MAKSKKDAKEKDLKSLKEEKPGKDKKSKKKEKSVEEKPSKNAVSKKSKPKAGPVKKKAAQPKKIAEPKASIIFTTDEISLRAYFIAERRQAMGWPGDSDTDWVEAEKQLKAEAKKKARS